MALRGKDEKDTIFVNICIAICKMFKSARLYDLYICE